MTEWITGHTGRNDKPQGNQWVYNSRGWRAYEAAYVMMRYKMAGVK